MTTINTETLQEWLNYNPDTGVFTWVKKPNRRIKIGSVAGTVNWNGYTIIPIGGVRWRAHRLAWLYVYGNLPINDIDHINGNPSDNRISNLRDVSTAENIQNQKVAHSRNQTGLFGVSKRYGKYRSRICVNGVHHFLGWFNTPEEAHEAYLIAKRKFHTTCTI